MAAGLHAKWIAVYVQTPRHLTLSDEERSRVVETLRLAEKLGAETVTLTGDQVAQELLTFARSRNVTKIIVGKPVRPWWKEWIYGSVVSELVHCSGDTDIYVITGEAGKAVPSSGGLFSGPAIGPPTERPASGWRCPRPWLG